MNTLIPTYALYGEYLEETHEDILHFEPMRDRSSKHDWSIKPHKHDTLWQIFYLSNPNIVMQLDDEQYHTTGPVFVSVPPLSVHAFQFPSFVAGTVVSIRLPVISKMVQELPDANLFHQKAWVITEDDPEFEPMFHANESIKANTQKIDALRHKGMEISLQLLLLSFIRHTSSKSRPDPLQLQSYNDELLRNFCYLIEDNYQIKLADFEICQRAANINGFTQPEMPIHYRDISTKTIGQTAHFGSKANAAIYPIIHRRYCRTIGRC